MNILFCQLLFCVISGMKAEVLPIAWYGLRGNSTCLPLAESSKNLTGIKWTVNAVKDYAIVLNGKVTPKLPERFHYNPVNYDLCIRSLKDIDSGTYTANAVNSADFTELKITYRLTVEEAVHEPVMEMLERFNSTTGSCSVTVNCSVRADWRVFVCDDQRPCASRQDHPPGGVNITVSRGNGAVRCTGENHVSTNTETRPDICAVGNDSKAPASQSVVVLIVVCVVGVPLLVIMVVGVVLLVKRWLSSRDTSTQEVATPDRDASAAVRRPEEDPVYSTVKAPTTNVPRTTIESEAKQSVADSQAASVYSTVHQTQSQPEDTLYYTVQAVAPQRHLGAESSASAGEREAALEIPAESRHPVENVNTSSADFASQGELD